MTNYEKIQDMTVDEMRGFFESISPCCCCVYADDGCTARECRKGIKKWLEQEVEEWN